MATNPIGGSPSPVTFPNQLPPMPAVARILSRFDRDQLHGFIAVAIDLADAMENDPDLEEDDEPGQCDEDEVNTLHALATGGGPGCTISDIGEEDDPSGQSDEDGVNTGGVPRFGWGGPAGAGCPISDPDAEHDGREPDDGY